MAASAYYDSIQKMYMAFYGRPADPTGLETWAKIADNEGGMTLNVLANFIQGAEAQALYGNKSNAEVVNAAYNYLFGRDAEPAALTTWAAGIASPGDMANLLWNIMAGAGGADKVALDSKLAAAKAFTNAIDTTAEIIAFNGDASNAAARSFLASVTDADSLAAAIAPAQLAASVVAATTDSAAFTLTNNIDTATANIFESTPVYTPDGSKFINSLQDEDTLTGIGANPTLNVTLGTANDGAEDIITPTLNGVETINVKVSGAAGALDGATTSGLNLQDANGLETINVTRITDTDATVTFDQLQATVTNISLSNSTNGGDVTFTHKEEVLTGTDEELNVAITNVRNSSVAFNEDGDGVDDLGYYFETINLDAVGTNDIDTLTFQANGREGADQTLNVMAGAAAGAAGSLEINTLNIEGVDEMTLEANHRVDITQAKNGAVTQDDGINSADLNLLTITGAANVHIDGLDGDVADFGDAKGLTVAAGAMTGNLRLGIEGGTSRDDLLSVTSGSGNDEIAAFGHLGGDVVTKDGTDSVRTEEGNMLGSASIMTGEGNDDVTIDGNMGAIEDEESAGNQTFGEAMAAMIDTGNGDDTVSVVDLESALDWNNGPSLLNQADDTYFVAGASIVTGAGADQVEFRSVAEGASVDTGADIDTVSVSLSNDEVRTVLADDDTDADEVNTDGTNNAMGAMVALGAANDVISFTDTVSVDGASDLDTSKTIVGTDALLDGGEGSDILNITTLDAVTVTDINIGTAGDDNGADDFNAYVTGIETANLTIANQVVDGTLTAETVNDGDDTDGFIEVDVMRFDDALETINLTSQEQALETAVNSEVWEAGTKTAFVVRNLRQDVAMTLSANEATGVNGAGDLADDNLVDVSLTVDLEDASGTNDTFTLDLQDGNAGYTGDEDLDISLTMAETSSFPAGITPDTDYMVENVVINLDAGGSHYIHMNNFGDADFANSVDNQGTFMQWRNLNPVNNTLIADYNALPVAQKQQFGFGYAIATSFTINGAVAGENLVVDDVTADVISIEGASNVTLTVGEFSNDTDNRGNNYTITTGTGTDRIVMTEDLVDDEDTIDAGAGATRNTLVIRGDNSMGFDDTVQTENDEVWANKSNIQVLEMQTGYDSDADQATVVLDEEAFVTGIDTINLVGVSDVDQTLDIILGEDFFRTAMTVDANDADIDNVVITYTNNQDTVDSTLAISLNADDGSAFELNDVYDRVTVDMTIDINDTTASTTLIDATNGGEDDGDIQVVVTAGSINSMTLVDSEATDNGTITVTTADNWTLEDGTLTVNASAIGDGDANPVTGGMTFNGTAETDGNFVVTGTANNDNITGGINGDTLNGGAGNDTILGDDEVVLNQQVNEVVFNANYDAGDKVTVTVDGVTVTATLLAARTGTQVAAAFAEYITDAADGLTDKITMTGGDAIALSNTNGAVADGAVLTLTGATAGDEYVVTSAVTDVTPVAQVQTLTTSSNTDTINYISVVWNGTTYTVTNADVGGTETVTAAGLIAAINTYATTNGLTDVTAVISGSVLTITGPSDGSAFPVITQVTPTAQSTATLAATAGVVNAYVNTDAEVDLITAHETAVGGDDTINGDAGDDILDGSAGDDTINGGTGDDEITGGLGSDSLNGGAGEDTFIYNAVVESSGNNVDTITAFTAADDVIDFTAIATDLGFTDVEFVGTFADDTVADTFLTTGSANLQVVYVTGDNALYLDVDASGDINDGDMVINLVGVVGTLDQDNFVALIP